MYMIVWVAVIYLAVIYLLGCCYFLGFREHLSNCSDYYAFAVLRLSTRLVFRKKQGYINMNLLSQKLQSAGSF